MADKSYKLTLSLSDGSTINAGTITAPQGPNGANGATFTPSVSAAGVLSWTNNGGLTNPSPISIKGPKGDDAVITESDVEGWGFTRNTGTITEIKMNGVSKGKSGVVDLGTVLTAHTGLVGGNLVQYDSSALTLKDSGKKISDLATTSQVNAMLEDKQDKITSSNKLSASLVSGLSTVATSGSYNDLSNTPTIPDVSGKANISGQAFTGGISAPTISTGTDAANYFQTQRFRGEGNADTYYHAVDFGFAGHNQIDFHEYGGLYNFYQNTGGASNTCHLVGAFTPDGIKEGETLLKDKYLGKTGGSITGDLTVGGNLTINGTTTTVDSTTLQVKDKLIEVAHGNTAALTTPAGLVAPKYDGTNSGALVFDSTGTAYVGDVKLKDGNIDVANSGLQPLATRTGLVGGNLVQYDSTAQTLKDSGKKISDLATTSQVNAMLEDKQDKITSSNKLSSSLIDGLGAASAKAVDTAISANSTSTNLPTSKAVEDRINAHSGIDKVGTVTGVKMNGTTKNPSSGVVDLGTVLTDESKFAKMSDLPIYSLSGTTLTITM